MSETKHLDLSSRLGKARNRVYRVGVELEGGWSKLPEGVDALHGDSSVQFSEREGNGRRYDLPNAPRALQVGELPSPVLVPFSKKSDVLTLEKWMRHHYPSHVNKTCGMHVHMSFQNAFQYQALMEEKFMWTVLFYMDLWAHSAVGAGTIPRNHCIFERIRGENQYCMHQFHPDAQAIKTTKAYGHDPGSHRYTVLHYAYMRLGTIECRLLPMMPNVDIALSAIKRLMEVTSAYLAETASKSSLVIDGRLAGKGEVGATAEWLIKPHEVRHSEALSATI
jgi:hypothetical protein